MSELVDVAKSHVRSGRLEKARKVAGKILSENPDDPEALEVMADVETGRNNPAAALQHLTRAARTAGGNFALLMKLGVAQRDLEHYDAAIQTFQQMSALQPQDADMQYEWGLVHIRKAEHLLDGRALTSATGQPLDARAELLAAKARFEQALVLKPQFPMAQRGVTLCLLGMHEVFQACVSTVTFLKMKPDELEFIEHFKDMRLRLILEKALRPGSGTAGALPLRTPDAWDAAAVAEIQRVIPAPLTQTTAVFFHVDIGDKHPFLLPQKKVDYLATLAMACRSARLTQPNLAIVLLSDMDTNLAGFNDADYVVRLPRDPLHLMYARLRACNALVMSKRLQGPMLFVDTDLCLNRDFSPLFDGGFDIALTHRSPIRWPLMPVNEGLIIGAPQNPAAVEHFFAKYITYYDWIAQQPEPREHYGFDVKFWRGGQLSLGAFVGWRTPPHTPENVEIEGVRCRFLHTETHNYAVPSDGQVQKLDERWALHFKGLLAKSLMNRHIKHIEQRRA